MYSVEEICVSGCIIIFFAAFSLLIQIDILFKVTLNFGEQEQACWRQVRVVGWLTESL